MVKLRLRRKGRAHHPVYDIIAVDGRKPRDGAFLDRIGFYDPNITPSEVRIDHERAIYWLNVGAQPTDILRRIMSFEGVLLRRHLTFKGKSEAEIEVAIEEHKKVVNDRYFRNKDKRKKRKEAKKIAEAEEQQQES
ncbi:MAG: 30S ribosomal protein S16 [Candidatus Kapabacteria bacterium]|jgi:small subunit ribosomal protein S16|nr:30S ribosomal protein S16 [Candidatus Kapabacteria bacterium]